MSAGWEYSDSPSSMYSTHWESARWRAASTFSSTASAVSRSGDAPAAFSSEGAPVTGAFFSSGVVVSDMGLSSST